jgi:Mor family transcriptional regulator
MRELDKHYPPLLAALASDLRARMMRAGVAEELAERVAFESVEQLRAQWGGDEPYIGKGHQYDLTKRNREIVGKFNGRNHKDLCQEYDLSPMQLYRIIRETRAGPGAVSTDPIK